MPQMRLPVPTRQTGGGKGAGVLAYSSTLQTKQMQHSGITHRTVLVAKSRVIILVMCYHKNCFQNMSFENGVI